jgi:nucleotide-binding universal stress UspA family protein
VRGGLPALARPVSRWLNGQMIGGQMADELVVVGVDGSAESIEALRWAARYAEASGATIRAVRAWHYPAAVGPGPAGRTPQTVTDHVQQEMLDQLDDALSAVYPGGPPDYVQTRLAYGHSASTLVSEAQEADLLVVGNKGRGAFAGMLLGSVSMHCVTTAPCPVLVIRRT